MENNALARFKNEQNLLDKIRKIVKIKFPELLNCHQGDNYFIDNSLLWTAYQLIPGDIICAWWNLDRLTDEQAKNIFVTLRQLHQKTAGKLSQINIESEYNFLDDVSRRLLDIGDGISASERARVQRAIKVTRDFSHDLREKDYCFVHGDYHPGNIIFQGNKVFGLLDTDWARKGSYLEDLAYMIMMFLRDYRQPFKLIVENYQKFLSWYAIGKEDFPIFNEYLILYTFYDLHLFRDLEKLPSQEVNYEYQRKFLADVCLRF